MPALLDKPEPKAASADYGMGRWGKFRTEGDPTLASLEALNDLSLWHTVENVPILDEHTKKLKKAKVDDAGRPVIGADGKPEMEEVEFVCDEAKLHEIADINNLREEATADVAPIMIGHVRKDTPEIELGEIVGYQRNYHVGTFGPENKIALLATWQIRPDKLDLAKQFPRRSVELWPGELYIDPVCIIKRTPERDLGVLFYSKGHTMPVKNLYAKGGQPYRYEAEPEAAKPGEQQQDEEKLAPEHEEIANAYMRHYEKNHPVMKYMKSCYDKEQSQQPEGEEVKVDVEPEQNEAQLSGTNGEVPQPIKEARDSAGNGWNSNKERQAAAARMTEDDDWDSKQEHAKGGKPMKNQRNGEASQYAKLESRLNALEASNKTLKAANATLVRAQEESKCRIVLKDLDDDGFKINYAKDTAAMLPMSDAERVAYAKELREERARRDIAPVARNGFIRTAETEPYVPTDGNIAEGKFDEAYRYQKDHPEIEDFNVCLRKVGAIR